MLERFFIFLCTAIMLVSPAYAEDVIRIAGSTTVMSNLFMPHKQALQKKVMAELFLSPNGSSRGLEDLILGQADMAMISSNLDDVLEKVDAEKGALQEHWIGEDVIQILVHKDNPVKAISVSQLKGIMAGQIRSWSYLGGEDSRIIVVTEYENGGLRATFEKVHLGRKINTSDIVECATAAEIAPHAKNNRSALVVISRPFARNAEDLVQIDYPVVISLPLSLVTKGNPTPAQKLLIDTARDLLKRN